MEKHLKCGFCKLGKEVENICGRLWHDEIHKCTAHQRCMQYSALLCQYKMDKFGGFKFREVLKEQARGNKLKCSICHKLGKSSKSKVGGSASAGCAIQKCKKTFHFHCARVDEKARTRRIVLDEKGGRQETVVLYRVFCCKEHELKFLESDMRLTEDSGNEEYSNSSTEGEKDQDKEPLAENNVAMTSCDDDDQHRKSKRIKLDSDIERNESTSTFNQSSGQSFVICFTENSRNIPPSKFETLVNQAKELFQVEANGVFMWKYNMEQFSCQHMLLLLVEIGQALRDKDEARLHHLICLLGRNDVDRFNDQITSCDKSSVTKIEEYCRTLRRKIGDLFEEVNNIFGCAVVKYRTMESLDLAQVAYLVLSDTTDANGDMRQHMKQSYSLNNIKEERTNGSCEKTFSVHALDLEANLFHDVHSAEIEFKEQNFAEEAKALLKWLMADHDSFHCIEIYPKDELLPQYPNSSLAAVDHLCELLKPLKTSNGNHLPVVVVVKPLDSKTVIVATYLKKCLSKVIDEKLTDQHDVYIFIGISLNMDIKRISDFLPDYIFSKNYGVGVKAFKIGEGDYCSIVLHFWINIES